MNRCHSTAGSWLEWGNTSVRDALELLDFASTASSPNELCLGIAELACRKLGGQQAVVGIQNRLDDSPAFLMFNGEHAYAEKYVEYYHCQDPFDITQYLRGSTELYSPSRYLSKVSACDFIEYADITSTEYYADFCVPQKVHYSLITRMDGGSALRATLCVHRGKEAGPFSMGAVKMMEALSPHLSANLRRTVDEVVVSALDGDHEAAMIIVDERARVVYSNPVGESFIRSLGTEAGGGGRARSTEVFSLAVADGETTVQTAEGACVLESRRLSSGRSEALRVIQIRRAPDFDSQYAEKLRSRFRFSDREIEVLAAVIQGQRNKEIAKRLCVSEHTVKKHIQNMARKANVASRTALVHAALQQLHLLP